MITNLVYYKLSKGRAVYTGTALEVYKRMQEIPNEDIMVALEDIDIPEDEADLLGFADNIVNCLEVGCSAEMELPVYCHPDDDEPIIHKGKCGEELFTCDSCIELSEKVMEIK